jgi:hypothetical protein
MKPYIQIENTLTANTKAVIRNYRRYLLTAMADYLDVVRKDSVGFIIPSRFPGNRTNFRRMYRDQPSTPGRLTERTGALIKMLKDTNRWSAPTKRTMSMNGDAIQGNVRLSSAGTTISEEYVGTLSAYLRADAKYWPWRNDSVSKRSARPDKKQLLFRFRWETGIRGARRPFLEPAANANRFSTEKIIETKLNNLQMLGVIKYL